MDKAFMVSPLIGATANAAKPLSFSNNFLLELVERLPKGVQKSWQRKNRVLNRFGVQTFFREKVKSLSTSIKGRSLCFWPAFREISSGLSQSARDRLIMHSNHTIDGSVAKFSKV